ncbi:MAG: OmpA family protein [Bacteroidota bacterium]
MKRYILFSMLFFISFTFFSQKKAGSKTYSGMGALSELVMSSKCEVRSNFNLFFESNVSLTEKDRPMIWYKLLFHDSCKISFNLIPVDEIDRYEIEVYTSRPFTVPCTQSLDSAFFKVDSLSKKVAYNDNFQSETFRQSLYHTREIKVRPNESVYIIVNNISGPDAGHVLDVQTCDYSYVLKANKIKVDDASKIDRSAFKLPGMRLKSLVEKLCDETKGHELGYTQFLGDKMSTKNLTSKVLKTENKNQAVALNKFKEDTKSNKGIKQNSDSTFTGKNKKDTSKVPKQKSNLSNDLKLHSKNDSLNSKKDSGKSNIKNNLNGRNSKDSVSTVKVNKSNQSKNIDNKSKKDSLNSKSLSANKNVSASVKKNAKDSLVKNQNKSEVKSKLQKVDSLSLANNDAKTKKDSVNKLSSYQIRLIEKQRTDSINRVLKVRADSIAKSNEKLKQLSAKQKLDSLNRVIKQDLFSMLRNVSDDYKGQENSILSGYTLKDSIYNLLPTEKINHVNLDDKSEKNLNKSNSTKSVANNSPHNISVYFIVVDARNKKIIKTADVKYRISNTRNFYSTESIDSLSAFRAGFMNNTKMIVECNVFGYHHYKSKFEMDFAVNKDPVFYDFIFMQPLQKGEILGLPNVYFHPNSTVLKQSSYKELDKLVNYMNSTYAVVRIDGHTQGNKRIVNKDPKLKEEFHFKGSAKKLSKKRADRVYDYLIEKGINRNRISSKGFAGKRPKIKNPETKSEKEMNMRVEITIMDFTDKPPK